MTRSALLQQSRSLIDPYRVTKGDRFRLKDHRPDDTGTIDEGAADELLAHFVGAPAVHAVGLYGGWMAQGDGGVQLGMDAPSTPHGLT